MVKDGCHPGSIVFLACVLRVVAPHISRNGKSEQNYAYTQQVMLKKVGGCRDVARRLPIPFSLKLRKLIEPEAWGSVELSLPGSGCGGVSAGFLSLGHAGSIILSLIFLCYIASLG